MKLVTKAMLKRLPALDSMPQVPLEERQALARFFTPWDDWSWYVLEGSQQPDGDIVFLGYVVSSHGADFGSFSLSDLQQDFDARCMRVERDKMFVPCSVAELMARHDCY
jgi:hypothetical protein